MLIKGTLEICRDYLKRKLKEQQAILNNTPRYKYSKTIVKGKAYYYGTNRDGDKISLNKKPDLIKRIEFRERTVKVIDIIRHNVNLLEHCCNEYIPFTYWDEELIALPHRKNKLIDGDRNLVVKGIFYRSKSEMLIAMILEKLELEYVYEPIIRIEGKVFYPDFAIKRPSDGRIIYLEHFGRIFEEQYRIRIAEKIENYNLVGITLWNNLIMTFDDVDGGFDAAKVEKIIRMFLLD